MRRKAAWVGSKPSKVNHPWVTVTAKGFTEERLRGGNATGATEVRFDRFALFIDSAVEVDLPPAHLQVSLVDLPGIAHRTLVGLPAFLKLWNVAYYPSQDCARGDADAEFSDQFGQAPVAEFKTQIPAHTGDDNVVGEPTLTKERMTR